jgi:hypothetical protein
MLTASDHRANPAAYYEGSADRPHEARDRVLYSGQAGSYRFVRWISTDKRARVQERHWAHFVSAIRLSKSSPSRTMTPKPAAGLPTEVVNDKGRYHSRPMISFQHEAPRRKHFVELDNRKARNLA